MKKTAPPNLTNSGPLLTRRTVVGTLAGALAGAAALGNSEAQAATQPSAAPRAGEVWDAVVIGAGVFGSWSAWNLRKQGKKVLLVDAWGPSHARASSGGESRLTRTEYGGDEVFTRFAWESLPSVAVVAPVQRVSTGACTVVPATAAPLHAVPFHVNVAWRETMLLPRLATGSPMTIRCTWP